MAKVSVIIPVYGVEKYIERCARSLFEQTLDDMEFIFVNDYTNDDSIKILQSVLLDYPKRQSQTRIIHHEINKGLPIARRTGLGYATGDYIAHCDSDDWVEKDMYRVMYEKATTENADLIVCDYYESNGENKKRIVGSLDSIPNCLLGEMCMGYVTWAVWNKLIKRDIYSKIEIWPTKNMGEDMVLCLQLTSFCQQVRYVKIPLYNYFLNLNSISRRRSEESLYKAYCQVIDNAHLIIDFFENGLSPINISYIRSIKLITKNRLRYLFYDKKYVKIWRQTFCGVEKGILLDGNFSWKIRFKCLLVLLRIYPW